MDKQIRSFKFKWITLGVMLGKQIIWSIKTPVELHLVTRGKYLHTKLMRISILYIHCCQVRDLDFLTIEILTYGQEKNLKSIDQIFPISEKHFSFQFYVWNIIF